jgi:hypothetical protein
MWCTARDSYISPTRGHHGVDRPTWSPTSIDDISIWSLLSHPTTCGSPVRGDDNIGFIAVTPDKPDATIILRVADDSNIFFGSFLGKGTNGSILGSTIWCICRRSNPIETPSVRIERPSWIDLRSLFFGSISPGLFIFCIIRIVANIILRSRPVCSEDDWSISRSLISRVNFIRTPPLHVNVSSFRISNDKGSRERLTDDRPEDNRPCNDKPKGDKSDGCILCGRH